MQCERRVRAQRVSGSLTRELTQLPACRNRGSADDQRPNFLVISDLTPLNEVLSIFKQSYSHLMIAASFTEAATGQVRHACPSFCFFFCEICWSFCVHELQQCAKHFTWGEQGAPAMNLLGATPRSRRRVQ